MKRNTLSKGFTLIELLIVIVIIGILAGVLIAVINPTKQQNRAQDANVKATMNKVVLATQGYVSAYGSAPVDSQFLNSLQNAQDLGTPTCASGTDYVCQFNVTGNALPATCDASNGWRGNSTAACSYRYYRDSVNWTTDLGRFRVYAKSWGLVGTVFMYDTSVGAIQHCTDPADNFDTDVTSCVTP